MPRESSSRLRLHPICTLIPCTKPNLAARGPQSAAPKEAQTLWGPARISIPLSAEAIDWARVSLGSRKKRYSSPAHSKTSSKRARAAATVSLVKSASATPPAILRSTPQLLRLSRNIPMFRPTKSNPSLHPLRTGVAKKSSSSPRLPLLPSLFPLWFSASTPSLPTLPSPKKTPSSSPTSTTKPAILSSITLSGKPSPSTSISLPASTLFPTAKWLPLSA